MEVELWGGQRSEAEKNANVLMETVAHGMVRDGLLTTKQAEDWCRSHYVALLAPRWTTKCLQYLFHGFGKDDLRYVVMSINVAQKAEEVKP